MARNVDLPADITREAELHQHDFESKDVEQVQGNKKGNKRKMRKRTQTFEDDLVGQTKSYNSIEDFGQWSWTVISSLYLEICFLKESSSIYIWNI